jgi:hypothetical protein
MNSIFALTVIERDGSGTRTWAWFPTFEEAVESIQKSPEWYFEHGYYQYAVIEEVPAGPLLGKIYKATWYEAKFDPTKSDFYPDDANYEIIAIPEAPEPWRRTIWFGIG